MSGIEEGATAEVTIVVDSASTAARFAREPGEAYPEVLATPVMIGEMERAAAALMKPYLGVGELSVGVRIDITHVAPTPVGGQVVSHARFSGREGALFWFDVRSCDDSGEIGVGRHARAVVSVEAILTRAAKRKGKN